MYIFTTWGGGCENMAETLNMRRQYNMTQLAVYECRRQKIMISGSAARNWLEMSPISKIMKNMEKSKCWIWGAKLKERGLGWVRAGGSKVVPRNSSELLGGSSELGASSLGTPRNSSEVPRRFLGASPKRTQAGHPQAVAGEQIFKKVVNPLANIDFHEKLWKIWVCLLFSPMSGTFWPNLQKRIAGTDLFWWCVGSTLRICWWCVGNDWSNFDDVWVMWLLFANIWQSICYYLWAQLSALLVLFILYLLIIIVVIVVIAVSLVLFVIIVVFCCRLIMFTATCDKYYLLSLTIVTFTKGLFLCLHWLSWEFPFRVVFLFCLVFCWMFSWSETIYSLRLINFSNIVK